MVPGTVWEGIFLSQVSKDWVGPSTSITEARVKRRKLNIRVPFAKFVDSSYYFESELCGGAVTVSFSKYFPWQAMHFLQRSTHFSKTCCRPFITSKFLASELPFHGCKSPEIALARSGLYGGCSNGVSPIHFFHAEHRIQFRSRSIRFRAFPIMKRELRGKKFRSDQRSAARFREVGGAL
jgi:hypothetical protein